MDGKKTFYSPAKVNLFLQVVDKRPDGYHNIASLFQTVDVFDTLDFQLSEIDFFTTNDKSLPIDDSNLIVKALHLFRKKTGLKFHISIYLDKIIPQQAGMGGGSSNAATTLWALNELFGRPAQTEELMAWSSELGSDIPFFFSHGTAYCTGRGELVRDLPPLPETTLWIFKPGKGLSTPAVFDKFKLREASKYNPEDLLADFLVGDPNYFNDLEQAALEVLPSLNDFKQKIDQMGFKILCMTGSGTAFLCELKDPTAETIYPPVHFVNREQGEWYKKEGSS